MRRLSRKFRLFASFFSTILLATGLFVIAQNQQAVADFVYARFGGVKAALGSVTMNNGVSNLVTGNDLTSQTSALSPDIGAYRWTYDGDNFGAGAAVNLMKLNIPFNAGATMTDFSGAGADGSVNGAAALYTASGKVGGAAVFDGIDDYITLPNGSVSFANATQGTIVAWVKTSCANSFCPIFETDGDATGNYRVALRLASGVAAFDLYNGSYQSAFGSSNIADNSWHHVVGTWDASSIRVYVDGALNGTNSTASFTLDNYSAARSTIGAVYYPPIPPDYHDLYSGSIDELQVYARSLSASEITQLYNDGNAGVGGPTVIKSSATASGQLWNLIVTPISSSGTVGSALASSNMVLIAAGAGITGSVNAPNEMQSLTSTLTIPSGSIAGYRWLRNSSPIMVLNMPFNSGASQTDASGRGNNGSTVNSPSFSSGSGCKVGGCLNFNGSTQYVTVPHTSDLNLTGSSATIEFWFKPNALPGYRDVIQKGIGSGAAQWYVRTTSTNGLDFYVGNGVRGYAVSPTNAQAQLSIGTWTHYAYVVDDAAQQATLYVNGSAVLTAAASSSVLGPNTSALTIGGYTWDGYSVADMDEIRIYNVALPAAVVAQEYTDGRGSSQSATNGVGGPASITSSLHAAGEVWDLLTTEFLSGGGVGNLSYIGRATIAAAPVTTINVSTPAGTQNHGVTISYTCSASDNTTRDLLVEYSINGGSSYQSANITSPSSGTISGSTILGAACNGSSQNFSWDTIGDNIAAGSSNSTVRIRLTAQISAAPIGQTNNFTVANGAINTFSSPTSIASGNTTYDNSDVICDGTTLTIDGTHTFTSLRLKNNCVLQHSFTDTTTVYSLNLTVTGNLTVDSGASINVNGRGYVGGGNGGSPTLCGYTSGNTQYACGNTANKDGGSYGGLGGDDNAGGSGIPPTYGNVDNPTEPGGGGGAFEFQNTTAGGRGGGLIRLTVNGTLTNSGTITANAGSSVNMGAGGAGGGIYLNAGTLTGSGTISANGGAPGGNCFASDGGGGGGGRIAIFYTTNTFGGTISAYGGTGSCTTTPHGGAGTIYMKGTAQTYGNLIANNNGLTVGEATTGLSATPLNFENITISNKARVFSTTALNQITGALTIDNGWLTMNSTTQVPVASVALTNSAVIKAGFATTSTWYKVDLNVSGSVSIDATSSIDVGGRGYVAGGNGGSGSLCPYTSGNTIFNCGNVANKEGGSYGGLGGDASGGSGVPSSYGSVINPTEPGGGGGAYEFINATAGGRGGGLVRLTIAGTLTNNGSIAANGGAAVNMGAGGSGGGIYVSAGTITGSGSFTANGSDSATNCFAISGGGGGGGRIALYYTTSTHSGSVTAYGGTNVSCSGPVGGAGTIYTKSASQANGDLVIKNNNNTAIEASTPLPATPTVFDSITVNAKARLSSATLTQVVGAFTITDGWFTQASATQIQMGSLSMATSAIFTHAATTTSTVYKVNISVSGTVTIDATSSINADGRGYIGGGTGSSSLCGYTSGNVLYSCGGSNKHGGSYGGKAGTGAGSGIPAAYGSITDPNEPGGGGGSLEFINTSKGGNGGGLIRLSVAGTLTNSGSITANAGGSSNQGGGGAGGGIYIDTASLAGNGSITANGGGPGGNCFGGDGAGGGGGRIAVYYTASTYTGSTTAYPGAGSCSTTPHGAGGTVFIKDAAQSFGDLTVSNNNLNAAVTTTTPLIVTGGPSVYTFRNLSVINQGDLSIDSPCSGTVLTVNGFTSLAGNGTITNNQSGSCSSALGSITITTTSLPAAAIGSAYSQTVQSSGGYGPHTFTCRNGGSTVACTTVLPPGLNMSSSGVISGTATTAGTYNFTVRATEASPGSAFADKALSIGVSNSPTAPTNLFSHATNAQTCCTAPSGVDGSPVFSAIFNDPDVGETGTKYRIQVASDAGFTTLLWDSGAAGTSMAACTIGARCADIAYAGSALTMGGVTYHWKIKFFDSNGLEGPFSSTATFVTDVSPTAPTNLFSNESTAQTGLTNPIGMTTAHPVFSAIYHDGDLGDVANKYRIQVDDNNNFSSPVWDSGAAGTSLSNCNEGARCADITFGGPDLALDGATYYWRIKFWDVAGQQSPWSEDPTATNRFTMGIGAPATISTTTLPNGQVGVGYNQTLSATSGGFTPYVWTCRTGLAGSSVACSTVLPPGLNMNSSGVISGTPTTNGLYPFVVRVTEASPGTNFDEAALSIAIGQAPTAPTTLFTNSTNAQLGSANPTAIDATPVFSAIFHDPDATDTASKYEIQVATDSGLTNIIWDSGAGGTALTSCANNTRCASINFGGTALTLDGSTYYWRIKYWDQNGIAGAFSTESASFTVDRVPTAPTILFSAESNAQTGSVNPTNIRSIRPVFSAIYNDPDASDTAIKYRIQVDDANNFASPLWDNGAAGTSMTSCNQGTRCADIVYGAVLPLAIDGTIYYWRIKFFDAAGVESPWSEDPIATNKFTMGQQTSNVQPQVQNTIPNTPSIGSVQVMGSTILRYTWIDNSDNETGFRLLDDQGNVIVEVGAGVTTADEINLPANTSIGGRRVVAFNNAGVSSPSDAFATTITAAPTLSPVVVRRGVNSVTFTVNPSPSIQNLQQGSTAILYEIIIRPSDPTQPVRMLTSDWQKSGEYTFSGISPDDQVEVRVVTRNQAGYANEPTEYIPVDQLAHQFRVNLSVVKKGTSQLPELQDPQDIIAVTVRIQNSGSEASTNVFTNMVIPRYIKYQFGTLTIDGHTATDIADDDVALTSDRDVSAIWPRIAPGEEHTMSFDVSFDQAALRELKSAASASANPLISLQASVGFAESEDVFSSPVVTLQPDLGLISDAPTTQEQNVLQEVPVPAPNQQDTQQVSQLLDLLIEQEAQQDQSSQPASQTNGPQTQTTSSNDGASFNVDVTRTDGAKLSVTGLASPNQGQIEFTGTTSEPNAIVTLIFNDNVTVIVVSDELGNWHTFVSAAQLGIKPGQKSEVTITVIASKGDLHSDKVEVGRVEVALESTGDIATDFASTVSAIPGVTLFNEVRKVVSKVIVKQQPAIQTTLASTVPVIVASSVPLWGYLPYLPTMIYHAITYLVGLIGRKRKNQQRFYGVVYDSISKQPLALAIIRIYNKETNKLVSTQVSDKQGRYEALLEPALYRLEVTKPSYNFPSHIVTSDVDGAFQHVYHNEQGMAVQSEEIVVPDVPLDPINAQAQWQISSTGKKAWLAIQHVGDYLAAPILIVGSLASLAVVATVPENPINWLLAGTYVLMLAAQLKLRPHLEKAWGVVYDLASNAALPLTTIQLIDPQYGKVVTSRLTDYQGRYSFLPEPGHYVIRANKAGYEQIKEVVEAPDNNHHPITEQVDVEKEDQRITGDVPMRPNA